MAGGPYVDNQNTREIVMTMLVGVKRAVSHEGDNIIIVSCLAELCSLSHHGSVGYFLRTCTIMELVMPLVAIYFSDPITVSRAASMQPCWSSPNLCSDCAAFGPNILDSRLTLAGAILHCPRLHVA